MEEEHMRIAIYGAGSLGTVLGAYLSEANVAVDLVSRNREHIGALKSAGARIRGTREFTCSVHAMLPEDMEGSYDLIFLLTKQLKNREVAGFLKPFLAEEGILCTLQNGLPEPLLMEILGSRRVAGGTVGWGATLLEPGVAEITSEVDTLTFSIGLPVPGREEMLPAISSVLSVMGPVTIENNFMGARWSKLLINASFSGTATLLGMTFGEVASDRHARRVAQLVMKECLDCAEGASVRIEPVQGKDIARMFNYTGRIKQWVSFSLIPFALKKHRALKPSMLQDLEKGKLCEVDAINGVLSKEGRRVGVPTPVNDLLVELIHRIEKVELSPSPENIAFFASFLEKK